MKKQAIQLHYLEYNSPESLPDSDQLLLQEAERALSKAYAPYSQFRVGAAVRLINGAVHSGANCENAAYPMCICAEPAVLAAAASAHPGVAVAAMAIVVSHTDKPVGEPATPCGGCRQMLVEHEHRFQQPLRLILGSASGRVLVFERAADLLPLHFSGEVLT